MRSEAPFALPGNSLESLQIELANSLGTGVTGMLWRTVTVIPEFAYAPFAQSSISKLELAKHSLQPQSTLVLSTGGANLGAHNFSNEISPSSVIEAEAEATRLLGGNMQCIQLPTEAMAKQHTDNGLLARLLSFNSLQVGRKPI